jgi:SpoVK/Ycf46/Vps4 family AAA+-type ATPase
MDIHLRTWLSSLHEEIPGYEDLVSTIALNIILRGWKLLPSDKQISNQNLNVKSIDNRNINETNYGCLIVGLAGSGKSFLLSAIAQSTIAKSQTILFNTPRIVKFSLQDILSDAYTGAAEKKIDSMISYLHWIDDPLGSRKSIAILDNCEDFFPISTSFPLLERIRAKILRIATNPNITNASIIWLLSTRNIDFVHTLVLSSGPWKRNIFFLPDAMNNKQRLRVLKKLFSQTSINAKSEDLSLSDIADRCHGMRPSDLLQVVRIGLQLQIDEEKDLHAKEKSIFHYFLRAADVLRPDLVRSRTLTATLPPSSKEVNINELVGMDAIFFHAMELIKMSLDTEKRMKLYNEGKLPPKGMLIVGKSGSGKTNLALALARHAMDSGISNSIVVNATDIISPTLGASEKAIANLFLQAKALSPCVVVFDQLSTFASSYSSTPTFARLLAALCNELDQLETPNDTEALRIGGLRECASWQNSLHSALVSGNSLFWNNNNTDNTLKKVDSNFSLDISTLSAVAGRIICKSCEHCNYEHLNISSGNSLVASYNAPSVFIIGVANNRLEIADSLSRRGRLDTFISTPDVTSIIGSILLFRLFAQSPLENNNSEYDFYQLPTNICHGNNGISDILRSDPTISNEILKLNLSTNWSSLLLNIAVHICNECLCTHNSSVPTAAFFKKLHTVSALSAIRQAKNDNLVEACVISPKNIFDSLIAIKN